MSITQSDYERLLDVVMRFAARRGELTPSQKAVLDAYEGAEPYEKCLELMKAMSA